MHLPVKSSRPALRNTEAFPAELQKEMTSPQLPPSTVWGPGRPRGTGTSSPFTLKAENTPKSCALSPQPSHSQQGDHVYKS